MNLITGIPARESVMVKTMILVYGGYFIEIQEVPFGSIKGVLLLLASKIEEGLEPAAQFLSLSGYKAKVWRTEE